MNWLRYIWLHILLVLLGACSVFTTNQNNWSYANDLLITHGDSLTFKLNRNRVLIDSVCNLMSETTTKVGGANFTYLINDLKNGKNELAFNFHLSNTHIKRYRQNINIVSDIDPLIKEVHQYSLIPHDTSLFTQGLLIDDGYMYESAGLYGKSSLNKIDIKDGSIINQSRLDSIYFAEGLCCLKNELYLLTWKEGQVFCFSKNFQFERSFKYLHEGWGLTNNDSLLIASDGSSSLRFLSVDKLIENKDLIVVDNVGEINYLNELEFINGDIWGNVLGKNYVLIVDANSGRVKKRLDFSEPIKKYDLGQYGSFNGIAFNKSTNEVYFTGKNWPYYIICHLSDL